MGARFSDAQCGSRRSGRSGASVACRCQDTGWFFDTELPRAGGAGPGCRNPRVPVDWIDDLDSRVDIIATALGDLRGMARLGAGFARGTIKVPQLRGPSLAVPGLPLPVRCRCRSRGSRSSGGQHDRLRTAVPDAPRDHVGPGRET